MKRRKEKKRKTSLTDTPDRVVSEHGFSSNPTLVHTSPQRSIINNIPVLCLGIRVDMYSPTRSENGPARAWWSRSKVRTENKDLFFFFFG